MKIWKDTLLLYRHCALDFTMLHFNQCFPQVESSVTETDAVTRQETALSECHDKGQGITATTTATKETVLLKSYQSQPISRLKNTQTAMSQVKRQVR